MRTLDPYLNFKKNTREAFEFYKSVFGGEFSSVVTYDDMPMGENPLPDEYKGLLMHISLPLKTGNILMGTDITGSEPVTTTFGNNISLSINADSEAEGKQLYDALSAGGDAMMPFGPAEWGGLWGMLTDKFGVQWMVSFDENYNK